MHAWCLSAVAGRSARSFRMQQDAKTVILRSRHELVSDDGTADSWRPAGFGSRRTARSPFTSGGDTPPWPGGQAGSPDLVAQVDRALAVDCLDAAQIHPDGAEQPYASAEQHRRDMQHDLVDHPGGKGLLGDADATG